MWGIIFILILNFYISAADVAATLGGTVNLTCKEEGSIFGWHKLTDSGQAWFLLTDNKKYEGSIRTRLTIKIVDTNDAGVYRCFVFDKKNKFKAYGVNITVTLPESPLVPTTTTTASKTTTTSTTTTTTTTTITTTPTTTPTITTTTTPTKTTPTTTTTTPITTTTTPTATNLPAEWTSWRSWTACSANCGYGTRSRLRNCKQSKTCEPLNNRFCMGLSNETENCSVIVCTGTLFGSLTITCDLLNTVGLYWKKSENWGYITHNRNKYTGIYSANLKILNLQYTDNGHYRCESWKYVLYSTIGNYTEITVLGSPKVTISRPSHFVQSRTTVTLVCNIESSPQVSQVWWTDNKAQVITDKLRYIGGNIHNPNLTIITVKDSDSGVYTCNAKNTEGTSVANTTLLTGNITQATILKVFYVAIKGQDITLECLIKTDPSNKKLYWLKNGKDLRLYLSSKYSGGTLSKQSLTVKNIDNNDGGNYTCKLENQFGNSEDVAELKVLSVHVDDQVNLNIRANETVTLQCVVTGGNSVAWRRNNQIIDTTSSVRYSGGTVNTPSLTITNVTRYHTGNYTCETSYDLVKVTSKKTIELFVKDIPLVYQTSDNIQAYTGDTIHLKCVYESYPEPSAVFWKRDGENLNVSVSKYNGSTINEPSLTIYNTEQLDSGMYLCGVVNDIGIGYSSKIQLTIKDQEKTGDGLVLFVQIVPIVSGGIGAIVVFVAVFIICIVLKRRRHSNQKDINERKVNTELITDEQSVQYRPELGDDEASTSILMTSNRSTDGERIDRNMDHDSIKVNELKNYISQRHLNGELDNEYKKIPYGNLHSTTKAQQKDNLKKNRFKTTFPYDHSRVVLEPGHGQSSDYINANYVDGFKKEKCYIASQGPLRNTINDHWRMIWQNDTRKIIMLTNLIEGTNKKCERYWPEGGKPMTCGNLVLTLQTEKERAAYITREIKVEDKRTKEKRCIIQYHFTAWPDHGTPDPLYLVLFHKHVRSDHTSTENNGPLLVHCSAGIGRTGTYIGLDALYEEGLATGLVDVVKFVEKMRYCRMNMVQTPGQYVCLHYALLEAFTMKDTNVGKKEFGNIWREISEDKSPANRRRLHEEFEMLEAKKSDQEKAQYVAATSPENVEKNRNENIIPSDKNRLFLSSYDKGRTDYVNAVQAPSYTKFVGYLTTQLPLPDTKVDFWTMVRDHNSSTIVVFLNDAAEVDLVYSTSNDTFTCGKYSLDISRRKQEDLDVTSCKVVLSKKGDQSREIAMYLAVSNGLPNPQVLCKLVNCISTRVRMSNDPVTVVSGDGAKTCGVFCTFANAVSSMIIDKSANIFQLARLLQLRRPEFFADFEEYRLCYEALNVYLVSSNVYENF